MTSILRLIEIILRYQLRSNYLRDDKPFLHFFLQFLNVDEVLSIFEKKVEPHS